MNKSISVVIPVYQNEKSLEELFLNLNNLKKKLITLEIELEIICIDDGSTDNSYKTLKNLKQIYQFKLIKLSGNFGVNTALITGMKYVENQAVTFLAADLQDDPNEIYNMAIEWKKGSRLVICERETRNDPFASSIFSKIYYLFVRFFISSSFPKNGFDLFLLDKKYFKKLINSSPETNIPLLIFSLYPKPHKIKYHRKKRPYGKSTWTFEKKLKLFNDTFIKFTDLPIKISIYSSFIIFFSSILYLFFILNQALQGQIKVPGYASTIILISFFSSVIIFLQGIILQYLKRQFDDKKKIDESIIDELKM